jgi:hypothetical protein
MSKPKKGPRDAVRPESKVNAFDELGSLVKERRKYVDWIAALEAKKDQTPAAVYAKVHLDYETRLQAVVEKLSAHRGMLSEQQDTLRKSLAELEGQIEERTEERSEIELRAHVGELSAAALTEALRVADTEIEQLEAKRVSIETDLSRVEEFFAAAEGTGSIPAAAPRPKAGGFDELSFLNSVVGPEKSQGSEPPAAEAPPPPKPVEVPKPPVEVPAPRRPTPTPPASPPPTPAKPEPPPEPPVLPVAPPRTTVEKRPKVAEVAAAPAVEKATELDTPPMPKPVPRQSIALQMAAQTIEPGIETRASSDLGIIKTGDELPPSILADLKPGTSGEKPLAANIASNDPFKLTAAPGNTKSLKCRECGALNFATEWYCEKCGAELSVI